MDIRIYVEGGGDKSDTKARIREGFHRFLASAGFARGVARWKVIPCGSREAAYRSFVAALQEHTEAFNVLLVDSEEAVSKLPREHLKHRDRWEIPKISEEHIHLMACAVEAWLVADPEALARYYGRDFKKGALPRRKDVEAIRKEDLATALSNATSRTKKGPYHKIWHCSELLETIDPAIVRARARHCERLFATLTAKLG